MAVIHKLHSDYCVPMLAARSMVHQARALFANPPKPGPVAKAEAKLTKLRKQSPEKTSGRHIFMADAYAALRIVLASSGQPLTNDLRLKVMREHGLVYKKLPLLQRRKYEEAASNAILERRANLNEDILHTEALVGISRRRDLEERRAHGVQQCLLSAARFSESDIAAMTAEWHSSDFSMARVLALRQGALADLLPPSLADQATLGAQPCPLQLEDHSGAAASEWVKLICRHREAFRSCALLGTITGEPKAFAILFAMQRPLLVALSPLLPVDRTMPAFKDLPLASQFEFLAGRYDNEYQAVFGHSLFHGDLAFDAPGELEVLPHMQYMPGSRVVSHFDAIPLAAFCASLPKAAARKAAKPASEAEPTAMDPDLLKMYPWLEKYNRDLSSEHAEAPHVAQTLATHIPELPEIDDDMVLKTWALLEARRQEWAEEDVVHTTDFETFIRGGAWIQAHRGTAFDCIIARPCTEAARAWIQRYFPTKTAAFAYKKYGEESANMLALGWCHRMQHLFNLYADSGLEHFVYQGTDLNAYAPEPAYLQWLQALPGDSPARGRHEELAANRPLGPAFSSSAASSSAG